MANNKDTTLEARDNFITHATMLSDNEHAETLSKYIDVVEKDLEEWVELGVVYMSSLVSDGRYYFAINKKGDIVSAVVGDWNSLGSDSKPQKWEYEWRIGNDDARRQL